MEVLKSPPRRWRRPRDSLATAPPISPVALTKKRCRWPHCGHRPEHVILNHNNDGSHQHHHHPHHHLQCSNKFGWHRLLLLLRVHFAFFSSWRACDDDVTCRRRRRISISMRSVAAAVFSVLSVMTRSFQLTHARPLENTYSSIIMITRDLMAFESSHRSSSSSSSSFPEESISTFYSYDRSTVMTATPNSHPTIDDHLHDPLWTDGPVNWRAVCGDDAFASASGRDNCGKALMRQRKHFCGGDTVRLGPHRAEERSAHIWQSLADMTPQPNHIERLLNLDLSFSSSTAWLIDYLKGLGFWYIFLSLTLATGVVALFFVPTLCNCKYRRICCGSAEKEPLWVAVRGVPARCVMAWCLACPGVFLFGFTCLAVMYGVGLGRGVMVARCVEYDIIVGVLYGSQRANYTFPGTMHARDTVLEYHHVLIDMQERLTGVISIIDEQVKPAIPPAVEIIDHFGEHLDLVERNLASRPLHFGHWGVDTTASTWLYSDQMCLPCYFWRTDPDPPRVASIIEFYLEVADKLRDQLQFYQENQLQEAIDTVPEIADRMSLEELNRFALSLLDAVDHPLYYTITQTLVWIVMLVGPAAAVALWIFSTVSFAKLWTKYKVEIHKVQRPRRAFGCLCFFYSLLAFAMTFWGIFFLALSDLPTQGCHVVKNRLFDENAYWDMNLWNDLVHPSFSEMVTNCLTIHPNGTLLEGIIYAFPPMGDLRDAGTFIRQTVDDAEAEFRRVLIDEVQQLFLERLNRKMGEDAGRLVTLRPNPIERKFVSPRTLALRHAILFGRIGDKNQNFDEIAQTDKHATRLLLTAKEAIENARFLLSAGGTEISDKTLFASELYDPRTAFSLKNQLYALQSAADNFGCSVFFCDVESCCEFSPNAAKYNHCIALLGDKIIAIQPEDDGSQFWLKETLRDTRNLGEMEELMRCIESHLASHEDFDLHFEGTTTIQSPSASIQKLSKLDSSNETTAPIMTAEENLTQETSPLFIAAAQTTMFLNSLYVFCLRKKTRSTATLFTMYDESMLPSPLNYVDYDEFSNRLVQRWREIYDMVALTEAFGMPFEAIRDLGNEFDRQYDELNWNLNCQEPYDALIKGTNYVCDGMAVDLILAGSFWICVGLGCTIGAVLTWKVFRYFADRVVVVQMPIHSNISTTESPSSWKPSIWLPLVSGMRAHRLNQSRQSSPQTGDRMHAVYSSTGLEKENEERAARAEDEVDDGRNWCPAPRRRDSE